MGETKVSKKRGVPPGSAAIALAEREQMVERDKWHKDNEEWLKENWQAPMPGFFWKVAELANRKEEEIPQSLRAKGELLGVNARELLTAWEKYFDAKGMVSLEPHWDQLSRRDDALCEKEWGLMTDDAEQRKSEHLGNDARPGKVWRRREEIPEIPRPYCRWLRDTGERWKSEQTFLYKRFGAAEVREMLAGARVKSLKGRETRASVDGAFENALSLMTGDVERWKTKHPGRDARPGEVWRWVHDEQEKADAEEETKALKARATEIAWHDRDIVPPCPDDEEILCWFETLKRTDWKDRYQWPTVNRVRQCLAMPRKEILKIAKSGRWGNRDVKELPQREPRVETLAKGSYPPRRVELVTVAKPPETHLSPLALAKVLRRFAAEHPSLKADALALAKALSQK